jgi:hypothetical protein
MSRISLDRSSSMSFDLDLLGSSIHEGLLKKQGGRRKNWKKRWCVLLSDRIFYFKNAKVIATITTITTITITTITTITFIAHRAKSSRSKH